MALLGVSCSSSDSSMATEVSPGESSPTSTVSAAEKGEASSPLPDIELQDSSYIFDQNQLHTFELRLPQASLDFLNADPMAEEYVEGELVFEGETVGPVGIRYKGSVGKWVGCVGEGEIFADGGAKACTKLSMKVKINWDDPDAEFYGLRKLQFHSQNLDQTLMHERLGYLLFREMGVAAPRSVHARLVVNGEFVGLFALTEQIDGRFTRHNFEDGTGNLYKEVWPLRSDGKPRSNSEFYEGLKTNEDDKNLDMSQMISFAEQIASEDDGREVMRRWMDIEEIISYAVVDRTIRNDDGAFHWYCSTDEANYGSDCGNHNFYWYSNPSTGKVHLIPWDLDNAFENILFDANPVTPIADKWGETSNGCKGFAYGEWYLPQRSAACDKITYIWSTFEEEYERIHNEFLQGPFAKERVDLLLDAWEQQISPVVIEAAEAHDDALRFEEWQEALDVFRRSLAFAR
ncbi:MAG: CotH kinase family protein [Actinomycetota bacterium]|nr:CotH kinase family protein [Actinomycetota bacterium]MED5298794.1 CotH kinase family protein [Actinomycetota bacterium]